MKKARIALIVIAVIAVLAAGLYIGKGPQPEIVVPAETIFKLGPLNVTNTILTSWVVIIFLIAISVVATRTLKLMPSGLQNFMEAVIGFLLAQMEDIAGEKKARIFFPVIATIFLFVITSNWFGLFPFFNAIGKNEDVGHLVFEDLTSAHPHKLEFDKDGAVVKTKKFAGTPAEGDGSFLWFKPRANAVDFEVKKGEKPDQIMDRYIVFLAKYFGGMSVKAEEVEHPTPEIIKEAAKVLEENPKAPKLLFEHPEGGHGESGEIQSPVLGKVIHGVDFAGSKKFSLFIPVFRGVFSDLNNTLALGLIAFAMIEFWGFQAAGAGYLKKFFNLNGIMSFVGILELLSELIRIISFTFRLFGNIFAGEVLVLMLTFLMPFLLVDIIYGLELFVGFIQAAVFALLTLVFGVMATEHHGEDEHHEGHHDEDASADAHHHPGTAQVQ